VVVTVKDSPGHSVQGEILGAHPVDEKVVLWLRVGHGWPQTCIATMDKKATKDTAKANEYRVERVGKSMD
jgi:hypothetical protein